MDDVTKTCRTCGQSKPLDEFYSQKKRNGSMGTHSRCKDCYKAVQNERRAADPEKARRQQRESYQRNREQRLEDNRAYQEKNREAIRRQNAQYRRSPGFKERKSAYDLKRYWGLKADGYFDRPDVRQAKRAAVKKNKATLRGQANQAHHAARNKARELGRPEYLLEVEEVIEVMSHPCAICDSTERIELDHIIPFARGGAHKIGNLQALCRSCNRAKRDRTMTEFRMWLSRVKAVI